MSIFVFLDTNVYDNANFSFHNRQFSKLKALAQNDEISLLYNEVVYQEVYQHIEQNLTEAIDHFNQVIQENRAFAPYRDEGQWKDQLTLIDTNSMVEDLRKRWKSYLSDCNALKIDISNVDISSIVDKYFKKRFPFEGKKPNEFKDAIIVDSILQFSQKTEDDIYVVSIDKGFRKSFNSTGKIKTFSTLNKAINKAIQNEVNVSIELENLFQDDSIKNRIIADIDTALFSASVDIIDVFDELNILENRCKTIEFEYLDEIESNMASVIVTAMIEFTIEYDERDEDRSYYDKEDDCYYFETYNRYKSNYLTAAEIIVNIELTEESDEIIDPFKYVDIKIDKAFYLDDSNLIRRELIKTYDSDHYDDDDSDYGICPDCGRRMTFHTYAGAFCTNCESRH